MFTLTKGLFVRHVLWNGSKSGLKAVNALRFNGVRLMPLISDAQRYELKNHALSWTMGPPSDRSSWRTASGLGTPPLTRLFMLLSEFHAKGWNAKLAPPLKALPPCGAMMFM